MLESGSIGRRKRPLAETKKVEDLVALVREGRVRIPEFQRGPKWVADDVLDLFDSIYQGFPLGALLLWKRPAPAERLAMGPLVVDAAEFSEALWVVDGQQRLLSLTASLAHPEPLPTTPDDPFVVYFDPQHHRFQRPPRDGKIDDHWVPLTALLDGSRLTEWVFQWPYAQDRDLRQVVFEAGSRIREYALPLYILETDDEKWIREVFYRTNNSGKPLEWREVHDALFGHRSDSPSTITELSESLRSLGMGRLDDARILTCLLAQRGLDVTQTLAKHRRRDPAVLEGATVDALPNLRRLFSFLRGDARIPHLRLLPETWQLDILTRFFALHPEPNARSRALLVRWLWRTFFGGTRDNERTLRRRGVAEISTNEEASVQLLLQMLEPVPDWRPSMQTRFDARKASSRLAMLALWHERPRDLLNGRPIDIASLLEEREAQAFARLSTTRGKVCGWARTAANRTIHSVSGRDGDLSLLVTERIANWGPEDSVLQSHLIDADAASRWREGDVERFLEHRADALGNAMVAMSRRMAAWGHSDRPSIEYLLHALESAS